MEGSVGVKSTIEGTESCDLLATLPAERLRGEYPSPSPFPLHPSPFTLPPRQKILIFSRLDLAADHRESPQQSAVDPHDLRYCSQPGKLSPVLCLSCTEKHIRDRALQQLCQHRRLCWLAVPSHQQYSRATHSIESDIVTYVPHPLLKPIPCPHQATSSSPPRAASRSPTSASRGPRRRLP